MRRKTGHLIETIDRFFGFLESINLWTGKVVSLLAIVMTLTVSYEVVVRYFFRAPTLWSTQLNAYFLCAYVLLAGGNALREGSHVRVDLFWSRLSARGKAISDLSTSLLVFAFCIVLVWKGSEMTMRSYISKAASSDAMAWPLYPSQLMVPLGGFLLGIQSMAKFWRDLSVLAQWSKL